MGSGHPAGREPIQGLTPWPPIPSRPVSCPFSAEWKPEGMEPIGACRAASLPRPVQGGAMESEQIGSGGADEKGWVRVGKESCQRRALPALMGPAAWKSIPRRGKSKHRSSEAGCGPLDPGEQWERALGRIGAGGSRAHTAHSLSQGFRCSSEMDPQAVTAIDLTCQRVILAPGWPSGWKDMRAAISLRLLSVVWHLTNTIKLGEANPGPRTANKAEGDCSLHPESCT